MTDVVPHVTESVVVCERKCALEAGERHVVLLRVVTTQTQVVVQLCVVNAHLQETPTRRYFITLQFDILYRLQCKELVNYCCITPLNRTAPLNR